MREGHSEKGCGMEPDILKRLQSGLNDLGLSKVENCAKHFDRSAEVGELAEKCRFLLTDDLTKPHRVLVGHDWELPVHGLVFDPQLGTIGVIQVCLVNSNAADDKIAESIECFIQQVF